MLLFHPPTIVEIGMVGLSFILPTCLQNRCITLYTLIVGVREYGEAANSIEFNNNLYQTLVSASGGAGVRFIARVRSAHRSEL